VVLTEKEARMALTIATVEGEPTASLLPLCCVQLATDLVSCLQATACAPALPGSAREHTLEVSARAALYRWLAHCRGHRRAAAA
jgi:hypothetical protein